MELNTGVARVGSSHTTLAVILRNGETKDLRLFFPALAVFCSDRPRFVRTKSSDLPVLRQ